jgi:hypothetical protein
MQGEGGECCAGGGWRVLCRGRVASAVQGEGGECCAGGGWRVLCRGRVASAVQGEGGTCCLASASARCSSRINYCQQVSTCGMSTWSSSGGKPSASTGTLTM